jgi:negative regulator of sigma E activity
MSAGSSKMSDSERMMKLMAYTDGELEGKELEEVRSWIKNDNKSVRFANEVANLGDYLRVGHKASKDAKAIASFDLTDAIMAKVEAEPVVAQKKTAEEKKSEKSEKSNVVQFNSERARKQKNLKFGGAVAAALALAASVFFLTRHKETEAPLARTTTTVVQPSPATSTGPGVDVDVANGSPGHSVSVFYLPNETTTTTTTSVMVWVDESGGK